MRARWLRPAAAVVLPAALAAAWALFWVRDSRAYRLELTEAERALDAGRLGLARERLRALSARRPTDGEAAYHLGLCEEARGNSAEALACWSAVRLDSPFAAKAAVRRARSLIDLGRFAEAESLLERLPPEGTAPEAREALELIYRLEGRVDDVRRVVLETWPAASDPGLVLRRLYLLDHSAFPSGFVSAMLARGDAGDDRVALGRLNLATLAGKLDEATRWRDACLARRPNDTAVWRGALDLARADADAPAAWAAARRLPASAFGEAERLRLRAWFARAAGNRGAEREALRALVAEEPGDTAAWERLAALSDAPDALRHLRARKAEADARHARYKALIDRDDRNRCAEELARLAEALGRRVEARGWSLIREGKGGRAPLLAETTAAGSGETLADQLVDLKPATDQTPRRPSEPSAPRVRFDDHAARAGLTFVYDNGHTTRRPPPPEAMGGGAALLDYDDDGWLDLYVVQGGPFPPDAGATRNGDRLYHNRGDGTFEDATARAGIAELARGYGHGVTVGDYDGDGRPDLFITRWRTYALYRNRGDGTFEDATARAGLDGERDWPTSAAFADLDGDGDLDLYVCHYLAYDEHNPKRCEHPDAPSRHDCSPIDFEPLPDHAFRNDGGRFVDVTKTAGLWEQAGRGLGVVAADFDGDRRVDLYVANDMSANYLFRNLGGFRFQEVGLETGAAVSAEGGYKAGMGVACGDLDGDGMIDLAVTNFFGESTTYYRNLGGGQFTDQTAAVGLAAPTRLLLGFGIGFHDFDNDGRLDVLSANGHVLDGRPRYPWMMPLQLLAGSGDGRVVDVSEHAGAPFGPAHLGRGFAAGDVDNDGRVDAVVVCQNEPLVYLHNQTAPSGTHFAIVQLEGRTANRDAVGTEVTLRAGGRRCVAQRIGGGNYQSADDPRLHFGLGPAAMIDAIEVRWPSGRVDRHERLDSDRAYRIREGDAHPRPLEGFARRPASPAGDCRKTAGDCPNFARSSEQNETVPLPESRFATVLPAVSQHLDVERQAQP